MLSSKSVVVLATMVLVTSMASALPIVFDGYITDAAGLNQDFYIAQLDDVNEAGVPDNLDLKSVRFDIDDTWFYMGLELWEGPLSLVGDPTSFRNMTLAFSEFTPGGTLDLVVNSGGLAKVELGGVLLVENVDYEYLLGNAGATAGLELRIKKTTFGPLNFDFFAQLDGNGEYQDDQISGTVYVPEPLTMAFVAMGVPLLLARRLRK